MKIPSVFPVTSMIIGGCVDIDCGINAFAASGSVRLTRMVGEVGITGRVWRLARVVLSAVLGQGLTTSAASASCRLNAPVWRLIQTPFVGVPWACAAGMTANEAPSKLIATASKECVGNFVFGAIQ
jgi:hypothetical protein